MSKLYLQIQKISQMPTCTPSKKRAEISSTNALKIYTEQFVTKAKIASSLIDSDSS